MKPDHRTASGRKKSTSTSGQRTDGPQWAQPISEQEPCGPNLEYEPEYAALAARLEPQSDAQYGDFVDRPAPPDWSDIERHCRQLLQRSKDLNLLIWLARCRARLGGAPALLEILDMLHTLLNTYPETLHPQHRIEGELDPAVRANALASLADPEGLLADLRQIALSTHHAQHLNVRDVERSLESPRHPDALTAEQVRQQLQDLHRRQHPPLLALQTLATLVSQIEQWAVHDLGEQAPDLSPLRRLLAPFAELATPRPMAVVQPPEADPSVPQPTGAVNNAPVITDVPAMPPSWATFEAEQDSPNTIAPNTCPRDTIRMQLRQARHWLEEHEPSSPVALLLAQAERLLGKSYLELTQALPPDLLTRWAEHTDPPPH